MDPETILNRDWLYPYERVRLEQYVDSQLDSQPHFFHNAMAAEINRIHAAAQAQQNIIRAIFEIALTIIFAIISWQVGG